MPHPVDYEITTYWGASPMMARSHQGVLELWVDGGDPDERPVRIDDPVSLLALADACRRAANV